MGLMVKPVRVKKQPLRNLLPKKLLERKNKYRLFFRANAANAAQHCCRRFLFLTNGKQTSALLPTHDKIFHQKTTTNIKILYLFDYKTKFEIEINRLEIFSIYRQVKRV